MATQAKNHLAREAHSDPTKDAVDAVARDLGLSESDMQRAAQQAAQVSLDEALVRSVQVAIVERVPEPVTLWNGEEGIRYRAVKRIADLDLNLTVQLQLRAYAFYQAQGNERGKDVDPTALLTLMLPLILEVWRESEPDMTLERLQSGLTMEQVARLFQELFPR